MENKEAIEFLIDLQNELKTQDKDSQAEPRFWVIADYKRTSAADGFGDRTVLVDNEGNTWADHQEFIKYYLEAQEIDDLIDKFGLSMVGEFLTLESLEEIADFLKDQFRDDKYFVCDEQEIHIIRQDTMFLTKQEAKDHLKSNKHHYSSKAHIYAMTAWRAPKVGKLLEILETFDFKALLDKKSC